MKKDESLDILQVINCAVGGGAELLVHELTRRFALRGHQAGNCYLNPSPQAAKKNLRFRLRNLAGFVNVSLRLLTSRRPPDVCHGHLFPAFYAVAFFAPAGCVKVITEHNTVYTRRKYALFRWLDGLAYGRLDAIICISDGVRHGLARMYPQHAARMITIYNGVDIERFRRPRRTGQGLPLAGAVCRLSEQKNLAMLLRAFAAVKDLYAGLWIIGDGEERRNLEALAVELGLGGHVKFWGFQREPEQLLAQVDVLCHVPIWEGFGLSVVEGMASGCALLASNVDGLRELLRDDSEGPVAVVVDPTSVEAIVHGLRRLGGDASLRQQLVTRGRRRAESFTLEIMADSYEALYDKVVASRRAGAGVVTGGNRDGCI